MSAIESAHMKTGELVYVYIVSASQVEVDRPWAMDVVMDVDVDVDVDMDVD